MGTFGRLVFCEVKTQIVGKTKFFDSLMLPVSGSLLLLSFWNISEGKLDALLNLDFAALNICAILREDNSGTKQETLYFLRNMGLSLDELNVIAVMDDAASLIRCITLGMGVSILSRATVQNDAQSGRLLLFPLGQSAFLRRLYIVYPSARRMSERTRRFLDFMKEYYQTGQRQA